MLFGGGGDNVGAGVPHDPVMMAAMASATHRANPERAAASSSPGMGRV